MLLNNVVVQNGAHVGDGVLLNPGVEIHHDSFVDDYALIYTNSVVRTLAHVGKRVRIGSTVSVSNNINIVDKSDIPNSDVNMAYSEHARRYLADTGLPKERTYVTGCGYGGADEF